MSALTFGLLPEQMQQTILFFVRDPGSTARVCRLWHKLSTDELSFQSIFDSLQNFIGESRFERLLNRLKIDQDRSKADVVKQLFMQVDQSLQKFPNGSQVEGGSKALTRNGFFCPLRFEENLKKLTTCSLGAKKLKEFPKYICELTLLEDLLIDMNQISVLPMAISNLTELRTLSASGNQITDLPSVVGQLTELRYIDLVNNPLKRVHAALLSLPQLESMSILDYCIWKSSGQVSLEAFLKRSGIEIYYGETKEALSFSTVFTSLASYLSPPQKRHAVLLE